MNTVDVWPAVDTSVPHPARRYNYWLGGKDNFAVDRESGDEIAKRWPAVVTAARENRAFLQRSVRYLTQEHGIRQFLDIGTGLPTAANTHEIAQAVYPGCRIVYVDNDPLVLVHARALLTSTPQGATSFVHADLRDGPEILQAAARTLNFGKPIALLLVAILHFIPDGADPYALVETLKAALPPGSAMVLSHGSYDLIPQRNAEALTLDTYPGSDDFHARTRQAVRKFFADFPLIAPGLDLNRRERGEPEVDVVSEWGRGPDERRPAREEVSTWGGVALKLSVEYAPSP